MKKKLSENQQVITLISLLNDIILWPGLHDVRTVKEIHFITFGYKMSKSTPADRMIVADFLLEFRKFAKKYLKDRTDQAWYKIIASRTPSDEEGLKMFEIIFKLFTEAAHFKSVGLSPV
ncbi:hypothetical protein [Ferruginibacter sp. HRS2-29]|uniref:hypothetical protein n=1 Tax=Ferruginibacter sp. HRS2-29 TaxID=2487334 RepID=UPI0020CB9910|nr:hypothetical protein [Ferruginibacter sp. HRS2-29]MCP9752444.1 hypothetical protein [Ferruginibacter sp. HRS2-29]